MAEEEDKKPLPLLALRDLPLLGDGVKIKLDCAEPAKSAEGKYGMWYLWFGYVENTKVVEGRGANAKPVEGYTGKILFFPTEKLSEKLVKMCNGNIEVDVQITKTVEEGRKGLIRRYVPEKLSEGRPIQSSLSPTENKLIDDAEKLMSKNFKLDEAGFIKASQEDIYEGKISESRAKYLFTLL